MDNEKKLRLPGSPSGSKQDRSQGSRMMVEVDGVPVWVDSSKLSALTENPGAQGAAPSGSSESDQAKSLASRMRSKLGISEKK